MLIGHAKRTEELQSLHKNGGLGHAYLFFGPPQVGKFALAKQLAEYLETGAWPEEEGRRALTDALVTGPDEKGVIGIDAARAVREFLSQKPFVSARRTAIVDRAELFTSEAQNALLKVAEEPPESALLVLILPDPEILWPTLQSRFQKMYFPQVAQKDIEAWLKKEHGADAKKAAAAAKASGGRPGAALDLLQGKGAERRELAERFFDTPPAARKDFVKELTEPEDFNFAAFLDSLIAHLAAGPRPGGGKNSELWHAVLELRRMQDATNLSPRIQLMNLWTLT